MKGTTYGKPPYMRRMTFLEAISDNDMEEEDKENAPGPNDARQ